jgi:hypothetical protein
MESSADRSTANLGTEIDADVRAGLKSMANSIHNVATERRALTPSISANGVDIVRWTKWRRLEGRHHESIG